MLMMKGRTAVVSGAGGGVGMEIIRSFLKNEMNVVICSSSQQKADDTFARFKEEEKAHLLAVGCNVAIQNEVKRCYQAATDRFGSIDVLVNGAGMHDKMGFEISMELWGKALDSILTGTFLMMKEAIPYLEKGKNPRIINLSTIDGRTGGYEGGVAAAAAKGGVIGCTRAAARKLAGKGITVNCIALGSVDGDIQEERSPEAEKAIVGKIPLGRLGTPKDIAPAVCFFASEESRYITGAVLDINGGLFMG